MKSRRLLTRRRALLAVATAVLALAAAGCGGGGSSGTTTTTSGAEQWAGGVCSAVAEWQTTLKGIVTSLKGTVPSKSTLTDAVAKARDATAKLRGTLKGLGKPDTSASAAAKSKLDQLAAELQTNAKKIEDTIAGASGASEVLTAVSTVSSTLVTMRNDVSTTVDELQKLDPTGELKHAFEQANSCAPFLTS